jgi:uncharacterized protein
MHRKTMPPMLASVESVKSVAFLVFSAQHMLSVSDFILAGLAAVAAGAVNALAGGGTLITFPTLIAIGIPPIAANVTNTIALCPGYLGATCAQSRDLQGQKKRMVRLLTAGAAGGIIGGILLLNTGERVFRTLVPFLILLASGLLAFQEPARSWLTRRAGETTAKPIKETWAVLPVLLAAIYGGYFGAGLSVIVLSVLGLTINDSLTRLSASKQAIAFSTNLAAALFFLFSGRVVWSVALVMAAGAILGGVLGGLLAGRINPIALRRIVVSIGVVVALVYLLR